MKIRPLRVPPGLNSLTPTFYGNPMITMFILVIDHQNHIGNTRFKGTPGVLKHYSGLPMANPGGPLKHIEILEVIFIYIKIES